MIVTWWWTPSVAWLLVGASTPSADEWRSRRLEEGICFELLMNYEGEGASWNATYTVSTSDSESVLYSGIVDEMWSEEQHTDLICLLETPTCVIIEVRATDDVRWTADESSSFVGTGFGYYRVLEEGTVIAVDTCQSSFQPVPAPTSRTRCFPFTMTDAAGDGWGGGYYHVYKVSGETQTVDTMRGGGFSYTETICVVGSPKECFVLQVVAGLGSEEVAWTLGDGVLSGGAPSSPQTFKVLADGEVVLTSCTSPPSSMPTTSAPSLSFESSPTAAEGDLVVFPETFVDLERALVEAEASHLSIRISSTILFSNEIEISGRKVSISSENGTASLDGGYRTRLFRLSRETTLSLSNLVLKNGFADSDDGGLIYVIEGSRLYLTSCHVDSCYSGSSGGAFLLSSSTLNAEHSMFTNNTGRFSGGVVRTTFSSTANFVNCTALSNSADREGGFGFATTSSTITSDDCTFKYHNSFTGPVVLVEVGTFIAQRSTFDSNVGVNGGVFANGAGSLVLTNCTFTSNVASERGGVMALIRDGTVDIVNCTMESNYASLYGGTIFSLASRLVAIGSTFVSNHAGEDGGVVDLFSATMRFEDCTFYSNRADTAGGVISSSSSTMTLVGNSFDQNVASMAGALYIRESSSVDVIRSSFSSNSAFSAAAGAVLIRHGSTLQMYGTTLTGNTALNATSNFLQCQVSSTVYVSRTTLDSSQTFEVATTCVSYFYLANKNGSREFNDDVLDEVLSDTGTIDRRYWTYPCTAGKYSSDGLEHGDSPEFEDRNGRTIDYNDPFCDPRANLSSILRCSSSCTACPSGTYSEFSLDRYALATVNSCKQCSIGRFLADDGMDSLLHDSEEDCSACPPGKYGAELGANKCSLCPIGRYAPTVASTFCLPAEPGSFVKEPGASQAVECAAGSFSVAEAAECQRCSAGTYQPATAQTTCALARPGYFVNESGKTEEIPCPPGTVSAGSGSKSCVPCNPGEYQPNSGRSSCLLARPGYSVNRIASVEQFDCQPGEFSTTGAANCSECEIGRYAPDATNSDCRTCPTPMSTTRPGSIYCDACLHGYFFDTIRWDEVGRQEWNSSGAQCVKCCIECHDEGMVCDKTGTELLSLEIKSGWWRATSQSKEVYECDLDDACKGGNSTGVDEQCSRGHEGALCGACKSNFEYSRVRNKCVQCSNTVHILGTAGSLLLLLALFVLVIVVWLKRFGSHEHWYALSGLVSMMAKDEISSGTDTGRELFSNGRRYGSETEREDGNENDAEQSEAKRERREQLWRSVLTKVKIVVATWQIAGSTEWVLTQVNFPDVYERVTRTLGTIGVNYFEVVSFDCLVDNWSYFDKLVLATVLPFVFIVLFVFSYLGVWKVCYTDAFHRERAKVLANAVYGTLLILYVTLPGASSWTFSYFNCIEYERGDGRGDLVVLIEDPSVKCTSSRYDAWFPYVVISCAVWPVGMPLGVGILLWSNRRRLNPININRKYLARPSIAGGRDDDHAFLREKSRHQVAMQQLAKLVVRDSDASLRSLQFVFEEYEPRCFMFPVFEILRRIFLTAMLMSFSPGSMAQVVVGLLASMISFAVYNHYEPYIEDDDDVVSAVAQTQLTLVYFASFVVYSSESMERKEGVFSSDTFGVFLVFLFLVSFFAAVWTVMLELWGYSIVIEKMDVTRRSLSANFRSSLRSMLSSQGASTRDSLDVDEIVGAHRASSLETVESAVEEEEVEDDEEKTQSPSVDTSIDVSSAEEAEFAPLGIE